MRALTINLTKIYKDGAYRAFEFYLNRRLSCRCTQTFSSAPTLASLLNRQFHLRILPDVTQDTLVFFSADQDFQLCRSQDRWMGHNPITEKREIRL